MQPGTLLADYLNEKSEGQVHWQSRLGQTVLHLVCQDLKTDARVFPVLLALLPLLSAQETRADCQSACLLAFTCVRAPVPILHICSMHHTLRATFP